MLVVVNVVFVPRYSYMACAWGGVAGYGTAMLLSYFVGQKKYPIDYPVKEMMVYVALTAMLTAGMTAANRLLPMGASLAVNTLLILVFVAYLVKRDFPLSGLPVIGKYFNKR